MLYGILLNFRSHFGSSHFGSSLRSGRSSARIQRAGHYWANHIPTSPQAPLSLSSLSLPCIGPQRRYNGVRGGVAPTSESPTRAGPLGCETGGGSGKVTATSFRPKDVWQRQRRW